MHRYRDAWLQLLHKRCGLLAINRIMASHRNQQDIQAIEPIDSIRPAAEVAKMRDTAASIIQYMDPIRPSQHPSCIIVIRIDAINGKRYS